jgi:hypothetical protein
MRLFPIPARGEMRVKLSYAHVLDPKRGGYETSVALRALTGRLADKASLSVDARSVWPIKLDLTKGFPFERKREYGSEVFSTSFEQEDFRPRRDLAIRYRPDRAEPGLALHVQETAGGERYFMAVITAGAETLRTPELALQGVKTTAVYPPRLGILRPGRVVHVFGMIEGRGTPIGVLRARRGSSEVEVMGTPVSGSTFVAGMWANERQRRILGRAQVDGAARTALVELGKSHGILTKYNAILAR